MRRVLNRPWLIVLMLALTACTSAANTPTPPAAPATNPPAPTDAPVSEATATPAPAENTPPSAIAPTPAPAGGEAIYAIVPQETTVSYAVDETFLNQNNRLNTAIGRTANVEGQITLNLNDPVKTQFGTFTVDISTLKSDSSRRDNAIKTQWLESARHPLATFVVRSIEGFPASPKEGEAITFKLLGDLTVKQTTKAMTWEVTAMLENEKLSGQATTFILMAEFGVEPPNIANILIVKDGVTLTLDFVMRPIQ